MNHSLKVTSKKPENKRKRGVLSDRAYHVEVVSHSEVDLCICVKTQRGTTDMKNSIHY
jgi:hypothetical protein